MQWQQLNTFSVFETTKGKLLITLPVMQQTPQNPFMICDLNAKALLFFNDKIGLTLDCIDKRISKKLYNSGSVFICECKAQDGLHPERVYEIPIQKTSQLKIVD